MPAERLEMRKVREIMRLRFGAGLAHKAIGRSLGISASTVRLTLQRATAAGRPGLAGSAPRAQAQACHAVGAVGGVHLRAALRLSAPAMSVRLLNLYGRRGSLTASARYSGELAGSDDLESPLWLADVLLFR